MMVRNNLMQGLCCSALLSAGPLVHAGEYLSGPADYIYTPRVEEGEREIDTKFGTQTPRSGEDNRQSGTSIGFGYGVNSWWFTEIYGKVIFHVLIKINIVFIFIQT